MSPDTLNPLLGIGTLAMQIATAGLLVAFLLRKRFPYFDQAIEPVGRWGLWIGLILAFVASALTLIYSEVFGIPPCPLCWWQRIFMYPQIVLFALALYLRERTVALYSIVLSILGAGVALYHHALQIAPPGTLPCPAEGEVSCSQVFLFELGYITYPLMALTAFAFLIVVMLIVRSDARRGF